jgi:hypothetical protein
MPPGAKAFRAGDVYSHGGLSPQECVTPDIMLGGSGANPGAAAAKIVCAQWRHRPPGAHTREVDPRDRHPE